MKNKDLTDPTLSIQEQKRIAIEILRQYHRWEMANPRPPEELPEWEAIGPFRKSKRHLIERTTTDPALARKQSGPAGQ